MNKTEPRRSSIAARIATVALVLLICGYASAQTSAPSADHAGGSARGQRAPLKPIKPNLPTLWIIGDSTVKNGQDTGYNGQWGWGNPIASYFDETKINVQNRALGGTSSRTYWRDIWPSVLNQIKPGDFVIMQFGHNDGGAINDNSRARATLKGNGEQVEEIDNMLTQKHEVVHTYGWYIRQFISQAKDKGAAMSIVCSPIPRNRWTNGTINPDGYGPVGKAAAEQVGTPFLDLNARIIEKYKALGEEKVTELYFPEKETTHTDWAGAVLNAECVIDGLKDLKSPVVQYLKPEPPKDLQNPMGRAR